MPIIVLSQVTLEILLDLYDELAITASSGLLIFKTLSCTKKIKPIYLKDIRIFQLTLAARNIVI